jgi:hypothetical protein
VVLCLLSQCFLHVGVTGCGIPRYNYMDRIEDGSVQAQVELPDMRAFTGDFASTREQVGIQ